MATPINPVITDAGLAAAIAANGLGLQLQITHVVLGASAYTPAATATALVDRRETAPVFTGAVLGNQATISVTHRASDYAGAAYGVGEIGFYAGDPDAGGVLFALWSAVGRSSPNRGGPNAINYQQTYTLTLNSVPTGSVTVVYDVAAAIAMASITTHLQAADPHTQYLRKAGNVGSPMSGPLILSGAATLANQAVTYQQLQDDGCPIGMIVDFLARTPLPGWIELNGSLLTRSTYAALWTYAQAQNMVSTEAQWALDRGRFSEGDGVTTFRLPDFRSRFRRSWDHGRGLDDGRDIGTTQTESVGSHTHAVRGDNTNGFIGGGQTPLTVQMSDRSPTGTYNLIESSSGTETRPANISVLTCIKAGGSTLPVAPTPPPGPPAPTPPAPAPSPTPPVAAFSATPVGVNFQPFDVVFTDQSTGAPTAWLWDFGDGTTSTAQNPTHNYTTTEVYTTWTVVLTVTNASGASSTVTKTNYIVANINDQLP